MKKHCAFCFNEIFAGSGLCEFHYFATIAAERAEIERQEAELCGAHEAEARQKEWETQTGLRKPKA